MNKLKLKHKKFDGCCLGKYKIRTIILHTDNEFDVVLEEPTEQIYYSFAFFKKDGILDDEFYTYKWEKKLFGDDYKDYDVDVTCKEIGSDVFNSTCNIAKFLVQNKLI